MARSPERALELMEAVWAPAVARVREEAWPRPEDAEEVHEASLMTASAASLLAMAANMSIALILIAAIHFVLVDAEQHIRGYYASDDPEALERLDLR